MRQVGVPALKEVRCDSPAGDEYREMTRNLSGSTAAGGWGLRRAAYDSRPQDLRVRTDDPQQRKRRTRGPAPSLLPVLERAQTDPEEACERLLCHARAQPDLAHTGNA